MRRSRTYQAEEEEAKNTVALTLVAKTRGGVPGAFVGVPEIFSVTDSAGTSTSASPVRPDVREAKGVVVAELVLPTMSATAPTPLLKA